MSSTTEKREWVDRVLFDGAGGGDRASADLEAFEMEAQSLRSSRAARHTDWITIGRLLTQLPAIVQGALDPASLSKLSDLNTKGSGGSEGGMPDASRTSFFRISDQIQAAFASAAAAAPGDALSRLSQLGVGASAGAGGGSGASRSDFVGTIATGLRALHDNAAGAQNVSSLSALAALRV